MDVKNQKLFLKIKGLTILLFSASIIFNILVFVAKTQAATLNFSPQSGTYSVGQTFNMEIDVSSSDQAMNAVQGTINFPSDKIAVVGTSKDSSILTLWVQEPSFSNIDGTVRFAGIVPNPGFTGQKGKILSIIFRAALPGEAYLTIIKGSVLANDGAGTQILTSVGNADIVIAPGQNNPPVTSGAPGTPAAPQISSPTHPDPSKWYSDHNPKFVWSVPNDVTAVRILSNKLPISTPVFLYSPAISEKQLNNVNDGIYYFHAQFKNARGWGGISHFKFQIDTTAPEPFQITFLNGRDSDNPNPRISFKTTDALSGMDYYKVKVGDGDFVTVPANVAEAGPYTIPPQTPGKKTIIVQAYDRAGNYTTASDQITIESITPPTITDYPQEISESDNFYVKGRTAYANATVRVYLRKDDSSSAPYEESKSDPNGNFTLIWDKKLSADSYKFWATATDSRGALSNPTDTFTILVKPSSWNRLVFWFINYVSVAISSAVIIIALLLLCYNLFHKLKKFRKKMREDIYEAEELLQEAFNSLKEDIEKELKTKITEKIKTQRLAKLGIVINDDKNTYNNVQNKYEEYLANYNSAQAALNSLIKSYDDQRSAYDTEVTSWNNQGGAPPEVADKLNHQLSELNSLANRINQDQNNLNQLVDNLNALGDTLREFTEKEKMIIERLRKSVDNSERLLKKEISDIKKDIG